MENKKVMKCPKCGAVLREEADFYACPECGAKFRKKTADPAPAPVAAPVAAPAVTYDAPATYAAPAAPLSSGIQLADGETVIRSWDYAIAGRTRKDKKQWNLTITNKRVISTGTNDISLSLNETPLSSVVGVSGSFARNRSFWLKVKLVIGIILCIAIIGIFIVKKALAALRACAFELTFTTSVLGKDYFGVGALAAGDQLQKKGFFARLFRRKFKVYVEKEMAKEILTEVGAIILNGQK